MTRRVVPLVAVAALVAAVLVQGQGAQSTTGRQMNPALRAALSNHPQFLPNGRPVPTLSGGYVTSYQDAVRDRALAQSGPSSPAHTPVFSVSSLGCQKIRHKTGRPDNIRANQDCGFRREAEEQVLVNPADPKNIIVGQNFSPLGFNQTGINWSVDGGKHWDTYGAPTRFLGCDGFSRDAYSDPAGAFDSQGNYYYSAVGFDLNSPIANLAVWKSDATHKGSFLHNPSTEFSANPVEVVQNCSDPLGIQPDKQFMAADAFAGSPYVDNVYMTWTNFEFTCGSGGDSYCASAIDFSRSTDGGVTWDPAKEISGNNPAICTFGDAFDPGRSPNDCNFDQGSIPVVGPDGTIYVAFNNCNTDENTAVLGAGMCQQLLVKSTDGGVTWSAPVKVSDDYGFQPFNLSGAQDPVTGCDFFRQCLPPNGYRQNDFPSMGIQNGTGKLAVFWSDFRNGGPCTDDTSFGVHIPVEPCANHNNDVFVSVSTDGGATWGAAEQASPAAGTSTAAQWQAWGDVGENGKLYVAYYDREYGTSETTGKNDITLATSGNNGTSWTYRRITVLTMPNLVPGNNPFQAGFLGDYMWTQAANGTVHMVWADTRGLGAIEEDVYYARVPQ